MATSIHIADDQFLIKEGIKAILAKKEGLNITAEANNKAELIDNLKLEQPNILILDYKLEGFLNVGDISEVMALAPKTNIFVITACRNKDEIVHALNFGIKSYLLKECDEKEILDAIEAINKGEKFFCGKVLDVIIDDHQPRSNPCSAIVLSKRESEIAGLMAQGKTSKEISCDLFLSPHTVNTHRKNIFKKLSINSASELTLYAVKHGLVDVD